MKDLGLQHVAVALVDATVRRRRVDEAHARLLAANIAQIGRLRQPIEVRRDDRGDGFRLVTGAHRFRAVQILGWRDIPAFVLDASDVECELVEIDDNLLRCDLSAAERATFLLERKRLCERLGLLPEIFHDPASRPAPGASLVPPPDDSGPIWQADEGDRRGFEARLLAEKQRAEQASQAKSEFLANMSHELRTPLNAIIGFAEMIKNEMVGPVGRAAYRDYAHDIHTSARHLLAIINDILDVAKVEEGQLKLSTETVDCARLIASAADFVRGRGDAAGLTLEIDVADDLPEIVADPKRVLQIVINLLSNAVKFTPRGGKVTLTARRGDESSGVMIEVSDTGIGMTEAEIEKALSPFGQVDSALNRKYEGSGLGLPLTEALIHLHGGWMEIKSLKGKGTTVRVALPGRIEEKLQGVLSPGARG